MSQASGSSAAGEEPREALVIGPPCPGDDVIRRAAAKAICVVEGRVLMLRPAGRDDLKFPGGGVEAGEADEVALARELAEECGYALVRVRGRAVDTYERRPATERPGAVFEMVSHYYWCEVDDAGLDRRLDGYEAALRLAPEWTPIDAAVAACRRAAAAAAALPWAPRELAVLEWLVSRPLEA